jgi:mono/diheme cytochrome c family protein
MTTARVAQLSLILLALTACERVLPTITWERMLDQPRGKAYAASPYFEDGKLMQAPPEGSVPAQLADPAPDDRAKQADGSYITALPRPLDRASLERGRNRFETFCATCHGIDGSGASEVAHHMELRRPPSLVADPVRSFPVGQIYEVIGTGYGLMPAYSHELDSRDRWAVVGYLRALQRSQASDLAKLPLGVRQQAEEQLR